LETIRAIMSSRGTSWAPFGVNGTDRVTNPLLFGPVPFFETARSWPTQQPGFVPDGDVRHLNLTGLTGLSVVGGVSSHLRGICSKNHQLPSGQFGKADQQMQGKQPQLAGWPELPDHAMSRCIS